MGGKLHILNYDTNAFQHLMFSHVFNVILDS